MRNYIKVTVVYFTWAFWDNGNQLGTADYHCFGFDTADAMARAEQFFTISPFRNTFNLIDTQRRYLELNKFNILNYWLAQNPNTLYELLNSLELLTYESPKKLWNSTKTPDGNWILPA